MLTPDQYVELLQRILGEFGLQVTGMEPPGYSEGECFLEGKSFLGIAEIQYQGGSILFRFPYPTSRGTFILRGKEYGPTLWAIPPDDIDQSNIDQFRILPAELWEITQILQQIGQNVSDYGLEAALNRTSYPHLFLLQATNPLAEVSERRKIFLDGGKQTFKERRYIHDSHRNRLCPLETPETEAIGLRLFLARRAGLQLQDDRLVIQPPSSPEGADILGLSASLVPFIQHDDGARAMMGAKNMKQALPLKELEPPLIKTGWEETVVELSGWVLRAEGSGTVVAVDDTSVTLQYGGDGTPRSYPLIPRHPTPEGVGVGHVLRVRKGDFVEPGRILAEGPAIKDGELALGRNVLVAYMPFRGYNFEDGIVVSRSAVEKFTSVHLYEYVLDRTDEDDPAWSEAPTVQEGQSVGRGDLLISTGVRRKVYDEYFPGRVVRVRKDDRRIVVWVEAERPLELGDKLINRHGGKGVVTRILSDEETPWFRCKDPQCECQPPRNRVHRIEVILNPAGVVSRMNLGQLLETHYGWVAWKGRLKDSTVGQPFRQVDIDELRQLLKDAGLPEGKADVYLGDKSLGQVVVGYQYMMKVNHLARDKFHVRNGGRGEPYSGITGQPTGGKRLGGGQRFGEMEVWALLAHGTWRLLEEMLTVKADDHKGKNMLLDELRRQQPPHDPPVRFPQTLEALRQFLRGLALELEFLDQQGNPTNLSDEIAQVRIRPVSCKEIREWRRPVRTLQDLTALDGMGYIEIRRVVRHPLAGSDSSPLGKSNHTCDRPCGSLCVVPVLPSSLRPDSEGAMHHLTYLYWDVLRGRPEALRRLWVEGFRHPRVIYSILDHLEGKYGLLRRHLLGKRQDFSGRAVIVPDPELSLDECSLPIEMAVRILPESLIARRFRREEVRREEKGSGSAQKWKDILDIYLAGLRGEERDLAEKEVKVLLNLSREFLPRWIMEVFSEENLPVLLNRQPTLHKYNLLAFRPKVRTDGFVIGIPPLVCAGYNADFDGDTMAVFLPLSSAAVAEARGLFPHLHMFKAANGELILHLAQDIVLGASFMAEDSQGLPKLQELLNAPDLKPPLTKGELIQRVTRRIRELGDQADKIKGLLWELQKSTFEAATCGKASFSFFDIWDLKPQIRKPRSRKLAEALVDIEDQLWNGIRGCWDNPFARYFLSGARGNRAQLRQVLGPIGYVRREDGTWIRKYIANGFVSGLTSEEYWYLCHSTRRTMLDKKLEVANAGDLTLRLVEGAYEMRITAEDCGDRGGLEIAFDGSGHTGALGIPVKYRHLYAGRVRVDTGQVLTENDVISLQNIRIRSPITCRTEDGICQRCYGHVPGTQAFPPIGAMIGILAAQSVGERGTQLSMQTFHTGGQPLDVDYVKKLLVWRGIQDLEQLLKRLLEIYGFSVAPIHYEVLIRAALRWGGGALDKAAQDLDRRGWLAVASFENLQKVLEEAVRRGILEDHLKSPKTWVMLGKWR